MRSYTITSGALFALLVLVHVFRLAAEGWGPLSSPVFLLSTLVSGAMAAWAWISVKSLKTPRVCADA
jgi:hypothetical protein